MITTSIRKAAKFVGDHAMRGVLGDRSFHARVTGSPVKGLRYCPLGIDDLSDDQVRRIGEYITREWARQREQQAPALRDGWPTLALEYFRVIGVRLAGVDVGKPEAT